MTQPENRTLIDRTVLKELIVYLEESQVPAIPSLMKIEGLERFEVHCNANCDAEITSAVQRKEQGDTALCRRSYSLRKLNRHSKENT